MKFNIKISKSANFYFFVQNLSEWHFSNRSEYNQIWREKLGNFSNAEETSLKEFAKIHKKYTFGKNYLGRFFFTSKKPMEQLQKLIFANDFHKVNSAFKLFQRHFNTIFKKDLPVLKNWKKLIEANLKKNSKITQEIDKRLSILYETKPSRQIIKIFLLLSAGKTSGGGANIEKQKSITLEISGSPPEKINDALGIVWHELIHLYFEKENYCPLIEKTLPQVPEDKKMKIREATTSALFPNGILGKRYLGLKSKGALHFSLLKASQTIPLLKMTKEYVGKNLALDESYIKKIYRIIK